MSREAPESRGIRDAIFAGLFFLAATALMTWPLPMHLRDGMTDLWDAKLVTRILHWDYRQTFRDPVNLFQLNFFHPAKYALAFSENLWGAALFGFPLLAAGATPVFNYNVLFLLGMFFSAWSAWALARYVTGDPLASVVGGLIFGFLPWRFSQLPHFQFQWAPFLCLSLLFLLRYLDEGRRSDAVLFGVFFGWNALTNVHYALFSGFVVAATLLSFAAWRTPERGKRIRAAVLAVALGGIAFLPFAVSYRKAAELYGMERSIGEMEAFSGRWTDFFSAGEKNRLYGPATKKWGKAEGDFFPGLAALALASIGVVGSRRRRGALATSEPGPSQRRRRAAKALDVAAAVLAAAWLASLAREGLRVGPLHLGDPGRVQVFLTVAVLLRLALAFPRQSRFEGLADFLRRSPLDRRAVLLLVVAAVGILVALGGHTPYYRFLFQSFGAIFRAIRAPARGIVLFHIALAVLAAWGLSRITKDLAPGKRLAVTCLAVIVLGVEYRAFPLKVYSIDAAPPAVYRWLARGPIPGAVIEWPFGDILDVEYVFRQTSHEKPLINGYSGFGPAFYRELRDRLALRKIPDEVWGRIRDLDGTVLIFHPHTLTGNDRLRYYRALRRGVESQRIEPLATFPHEGSVDLVFRIGRSPHWDARLPSGPAIGGPDEAMRQLRAREADLAPPFGVIQVPAEGQTVATGSWGYGWALDDSGIAEIRVGTEVGPGGMAMLGGRWPGLAEAFPDYEEASHGGFGFLVPPVLPGSHTLVVTLVGRDGGTTILRRSIIVSAAPGSPKPKGPGSG